MSELDLRQFEYLDFVYIGFSIQYQMTLIIRDELTAPPTWFASYRDLTLYCAVFLRLDVVLESSDKDIYVGWLRPRGGMDFIQDIVSPGSESGLRLDVSRRFPSTGTIITDRISPENVHRLIASISRRI